MVTLEEIDETNWREACALKIKKEQQDFVALPVAILARAYAYRKSHARVFAVKAENAVVGLMMIKWLTATPPCYTIEEFLIGEAFQNRGFGTQALTLALQAFSRERAFDTVEICVKKAAFAALHVYGMLGFQDTGYTDPEAPDSLILAKRL